jgi:hypothetical protein
MFNPTNGLPRHIIIEKGEHKGKIAMYCTKCLAQFTFSPPITREIHVFATSFCEVHSDCKPKRVEYKTYERKDYREGDFFNRLMREKPRPGKG